jgi:hypothetical protein
MGPPSTEEDAAEVSDRAAPRSTATFARSAWLFGRGLGLVFVIAFVSFHAQIDGLIGERGILPAALWLDALAERGLGFADVPTIAWWTGATNTSLHAICVTGELASVALLLGVLPGPSALSATLFYLSLSAIGGPFMAFQWDSLLVEVGFLASLFLPWRLVDRASDAREPHVVARWVIYLVALRLMFLSGVAKLRSGDAAWTGLSALDYHYFSQPLPNPLSWPVHQLPHAFQAASVFAVFLIELVLPFAIFLGVRGRRAAFAGFAGLMAIIGLTGNYGFFNLLALVLCIPLLDDDAIERLTPRRLRGRWPAIPGRPATLRGSSDLRGRILEVWREATRDRSAWARHARVAVLLPLALLGALQLTLSVGAGRVLPDVALDVLDAIRPFRVVNGYGLFATMTRTRREIRIEGSLDGHEWREYRFRDKPDDPGELPAQCAPHMPRLDWQMWFAALGDFRQSPWLPRFMMRLLEAEPSVLALLADDPFDGRPPRYVRARVADYRFGDLTLLRERGQYWRVGELEPYSPTFERR